MALNSNVAKAIWQGAGTDKQVARDTYTDNSSATQNSLYESVKGVYSSGVKTIQNNPNSIRDLVALTQAAQKGTTDKFSLLKRGLSALGSSVPGVIGSISTTLQDKIATTFGLSDQTRQAMQMTINQVSKVVTSSNPTNLTDLASLLNGITGNSKYAKALNLEAEAALFSTVLDTALTYGLTNIVDDVITQASDKYVSASALKFVSSSVISGSDLTTINKIIDEIGVEQFLVNNPDAIKDIISSYRFSSDTTVASYAAKLSELTTTLARINTNWYQYQRNGVWVPNLTVMSEASSNALTLFYLNETYRTMALTAPAYPVAEVSTIQAMLYPNNAF